MDAVPSMLAKPADMLPLEFWSIKSRIPQWDKTSLNVAVQRIILNGRFLIHFAGVEKLMTIEAIYVKKLKPQLNTRGEYRGRELTLNNLFKCKKFDF